MNYSEEEKAIEILNQFREGRLERDKLEIRAHGGFKIGEIYKILELNPAIYTVLNLIETQKAELEPIKKLNIPVKTLVSEWERLNNIEDNTVMLKAEIEKRDKTMNLMAEQLTTPIHDKKWVIEYYTKLAEENKQ